MIYSNQDSGTYEIPTDWTLTVIFNAGYLKGSINLLVKATNFDDADKKNINSIWQPTGTFHVTQKEKEASKQADENAQKRANELLKLELEKLKTESERKDLLLKTKEKERLAQLKRT